MFNKEEQFEIASVSQQKRKATKRISRPRQLLSSESRKIRPQQNYRDNLLVLKFKNTCVELFAVDAGRICGEPFFHSLAKFDCPNYSEVLSVTTKPRGA